MLYERNQQDLFSAFDTDMAGDPDEWNFGT